MLASVARCLAGELAPRTLKATTAIRATMARANMTTGAARSAATHIHQRRPPTALESPMRITSALFADAGDCARQIRGRSNPRQILALDHDLEGLAHYIDFALGEVVVERERDGALADGLGDGEHAGAEAELLAVERLEVDAREVVARADLLAAQAGDDAVAFLVRVRRRQTHDEDEPRHHRLGLHRRHDQVRVPRQPVDVPHGHRVA